MAGVPEAIEAAGAKLLFTPPYSRDLNPIELAFSKLKSLLPVKAIRTAEALWKALGDLCDSFSPGKCDGYFQSSWKRSNLKIAIGQQASAICRCDLAPRRHNPALCPPASSAL
jgi:DDE superfamily endonuclease